MPSSLTVASWPSYGFLKMQVRWSDIPISYKMYSYVVIRLKSAYEKWKILWEHNNVLWQRKCCNPYVFANKEMK